MAPEGTNGQPDLTGITTYTTPGDGDIVYNTDWVPGSNLGWMYYNQSWVKFGLTNTGIFNIADFGSDTHVGLGGAAESGYQLTVYEDVHITGDLVVDGAGGLGSGKYNVRTYTGDGTTQTFAISSGHSENSILVSINGVLQVPAVNYSVSGTNLVFGSGDAPRNGDLLQIRELPI